jgi:hypothetical protein
MWSYTWCMSKWYWIYRWIHVNWCLCHSQKQVVLTFCSHVFLLGIKAGYLYSIYLFIPCATIYLSIYIQVTILLYFIALIFHHLTMQKCSFFHAGLQMYVKSIFHLHNVFLIFLYWSCMQDLQFPLRLFKILYIVNDHVFNIVLF